MAHHTTSHPFILFLCLIFASCSQPADETAAASKSEVVTNQAAVAIPDPYVAEIAAQILQKGGNAVDAAVATGFGLAVTYIDAGNIGGGG